MFLRNLLLAVLFLTSSALYAQEDSVKSKDDWDWHWEWEWDDFDLGFRKSHPAITLQYGLATLQREDLQSLELVDPGLVELRLGYIKDRPAWRSEDIIKHKYSYLYLSNASNSLNSKDANTGELENDMWRFGFGWSSGYGYKLSESAAIVPYYTYTLNWSRIDFKEPQGLTSVSQSDESILNYYDESFRFGTSNEGGLRIKLIDNLILEAGYERSVVFQRHLFWKWLGSAVIEAAGQGLLDTFINEIFKSSPAAGPIVNFLLKNALAYGIYELRQEKMNWPFSSEAPMSYDQFKFGVTVAF